MKVEQINAALPLAMLHTTEEIRDLISVVIPTYNHAHFLGDAIASVLQQSYTKLEVLVVDDGSTDQSEAVAGAFTDDRLRYLRQPNRGLSGARNTGILAARGEYIALLDADDFWAPTYLARVHAALAMAQHWGAVHTGMRFVNSKGEALPQPGVATVPADQMYERLIDGEFFAPSAVLVRRACFREVGLFDETLRASEDWDMWLRVARHYHFGGITEPLLNYRVHGSNMSGNPETMLHFQLLTIEKHFGKVVGEPTTWSRNLQRAYGATAYFAAQGYYGRGDVAKGQAYLAKAFAANPTLLTSIALFYELGCVDQPLGQRGDPATLHLAHNGTVLLQSLAAIFAAATLPAQLQGQRQVAFTHAHLALGKLAHAAGDKAATRHHLWQALRLTPTLALRRSLLTMLLKSFVTKQLRPLVYRLKLSTHKGH